MSISPSTLKLERSFENLLIYIDKADRETAHMIKLTRAIKRLTWIMVIFVFFQILLGIINIALLL